MPSRALGQSSSHRNPSALQAHGGCKGAKLTRNVGSGGLIDEFGDAERAEPGNAFRHLLRRTRQSCCVGQREEVGNMRLVARVGLDQVTLVDREMPLILGTGFDRLAPAAPAW